MLSIYTAVRPVCAEESAPRDLGTYRISRAAIQPEDDNLVSRNRHLFVDENCSAALRVSGRKCEPFDKFRFFHGKEELCRSSDTLRSGLLSTLSRRIEAGSTAGLDPVLNQLGSHVEDVRQFLDGATKVQ